MQQFILYRRVSTKGQGQSGLGLAAQQRDLELYLSTYADAPFEVIAEFQDIQSGSANDRLELNKALDLCRKTDATLLVAKLDRLSRKVSFIATLMEDPKVTFKVASMPRASKIELHLYAILAEQERDFISLRTKAALVEAMARGKTLGGLRDKTGQRNVAVKAEALARANKVAALILPLKEAGKSLREIADALNASGVKTARQASWSAAQVMRTLDRLAHPASGQAEDERDRAMPSMRGAALSPRP